MRIIKHLFCDRKSDRAWRDQWNPETIVKNVFSPFSDHGTCFSCGGTGSKTLTCRVCDGSGEKHFDEKECFACRGTGMHYGKTCNRCDGTGVFKPAETVSCNKCGGRGTFSVTCRKCEGSGWHTF